MHFSHYALVKSTREKSCPHCRRKVRLLHKSETVAENGETTATVSLFYDSACGQALKVFWGLT